MTNCDIYDDLAVPIEGAHGIYVAISGNTCAGKSTLVQALELGAKRRGIEAIGISERVFHHQYLRLMFSQPDSFAFPIQLSFMLERHLILLRNLGLGRVVIMERSHLDDELFVCEHMSAGRISAVEFDAYRHLSVVLRQKIRLPDVLVLMNPQWELSLERLTLAEKHGDRPSEFPSEKAKEEWVRRWYSMYIELHDEFRKRCKSDPEFSGVTLIETDSNSSIDAIAENILGLIWRKACLLNPALGQVSESTQPPISFVD